MNERLPQWQRNVQALRRSFEQASAGTPLSCMVVHASDAERDRLSGPPQLRSDDSQIHLWHGGCFERAGPLIHRDGTPIQTDEVGDDHPWCRVCPSESGRSKAVFVMETLRHVVLWGDLSKQPTFSNLSSDMSSCVTGLPPHLLEQFPNETSQSQFIPETRWLWMVFDLAWQCRPHSPLQAKRRLWHGNTCYPYDLAKLQLFASDYGGRCDFPPEWTRRLPGFYFSELRDVFQASVYAIDMLIGDSGVLASGGQKDTTPPLQAIEGSTDFAVSESNTMPSIPPANPCIFDGGELVFYEDHVELLGLKVCRGPDKGITYAILGILRERMTNGMFRCFSGEALAQRVKAQRGQNAIAGSISRFRRRVVKVLADRGIECGTHDVIENDRSHGYRFTTHMTTRNYNEKPCQSTATATSSKKVDPVFRPKIRGHGTNAAGRDPVNATLDAEALTGGTPAGDHDDPPRQRRRWMLAEINAGRTLTRRQIQERFGISATTAKRDLRGLCAKGELEFTGPQKTGYYRAPVRPN